jgi:hypothetical protein
MDKFVVLSPVFRARQDLKILRDMQTTDALRSERDDVINFVGDTGSKREFSGSLVYFRDRIEVAPGRSCI